MEKATIFREIDREIGRIVELKMSTRFCWGIWTDGCSDKITVFNSGLVFVNLVRAISRFWFRWYRGIREIRQTRERKQTRDRIQIESFRCNSGSRGIAPFSFSHAAASHAGALDCPCDGQTQPGPFAEFVIIALKRSGLIESTSTPFGETPKDQHGSGMPAGNRIAVQGNRERGGSKGAKDGEQER